jgi:hypothetical protein
MIASSRDNETKHNFELIKYARSISCEHNKLIHNKLIHGLKDGTLVLDIMSVYDRQSNFDIKNCLKIVKIYCTSYKVKLKDRSQSHQSVPPI